MLLVCTRECPTNPNWLTNECYFVSLILLFCYNFAGKFELPPWRQCLAFDLTPPLLLTNYSLNLVFTSLSDKANVAPRQGTHRNVTVRRSTHCGRKSGLPNRDNPQFGTNLDSFPPLGAATPINTDHLINTTFENHEGYLSDLDPLDANIDHNQQPTRHYQHTQVLQPHDPNRPRNIQIMGKQGPRSAQQGAKKRQQTARQEALQRKALEEKERRERAQQRKAQANIDEDDDDEEDIDNTQRRTGPPPVAATANRRGRDDSDDSIVPAPTKRAKGHGRRRKQPVDYESGLDSAYEQGEDSEEDEEMGYLDNTVACKMDLVPVSLDSDGELDLANNPDLDMTLSKMSSKDRNQIKALLKVQAQEATDAKAACSEALKAKGKANGEMWDRVKTETIHAFRFQKLFDDTQLPKLTEYVLKKIPITSKWNQKQWAKHIKTYSGAVSYTIQQKRDYAQQELKHAVMVILYGGRGKWDPLYDLVHHGYRSEEEVKEILEGKMPWETYEDDATVAPFEMPKHEEFTKEAILKMARR